VWLTPHEVILIPQGRRAPNQLESKINKNIIPIKET
jgi:hypothetical protein